jgi:hypothetical protein
MIAERSMTKSKDLERFVEDRSQLGKDRAAANPAAFVVLDLWLRDAQPNQRARLLRSQSPPRVRQQRFDAIPVAQ